MTVDGSQVASFDYGCAKVSIGGEWRATQMTPCILANTGIQTVDTRGLSDGPHALGSCETDFAGNVGCAAVRTLLVDNNPPAHPRSATIAGGEGWRRVDDFDLVWQNPDQAPASPIGGALWRIVGPGGFDTGARFAAGRDIRELSNLSVPRAGVYSVALWLRDEAGNDAPTTNVSVPLRFDDVPPGVAFAAAEGDGFPEVLRADVFDEHSGPADGEIRYRRIGSEEWVDLSARLQRTDSAQRAQLIARLPESLPAGTYLFRADSADAAGNTTSTTRRVDGTEMTLRKDASRESHEPVRRKSSSSSQGRTADSKSRIFAKLVWRKRRGPAITVPFGAAAQLGGRLVDAEGAGIAGARVRVVVRPSKGALAPVRSLFARTTGGGAFHVALAPSTSRRISIRFAGDGRHDSSRRTPLRLRVRSGVELRARPTSLSTGTAMRLWGRVASGGAAIPRRGKLVAVQYLEEATGQWRPVLVTRSDHAGRFEARYRFRYVSGAARIRLRAIALAEERWPFAPGASRQLTIRVTG